MGSHLTLTGFVLFNPESDLGLVEWEANHDTIELQHLSIGGKNPDYLFNLGREIECPLNKTNVSKIMNDKMNASKKFFFTDV